MSTFDCPEKTKLGQCAVIEEVMIGEDKLLRFSGMPCFTDFFTVFYFLPENICQSVKHLCI